ncbi:uncharacterized protein LOC105443678 [Strongylocentrotus purpuratus]|uniref:Uncharacterized protein n=1 Tax=Strongylocentrotus purpuratus TaxID=7668 RepID=A0A7M7P9M1_STRPU|nr:uncharacterized protein LOC105443678 [Strongylocentrotus purpuratus]
MVTAGKPDASYLSVPRRAQIELARETCSKVIFEHLKDTRSELCKDEIESDLLRVVPILLECPAFDRPDKEWGDRIIREMAETLILMHEAAKRNYEVLVRWCDKDSDLLTRVIKVYLQAFRNLLKCCWDNTVPIPRDNLYLAMLEILRQINESLGYKVPVNQFYILQPGDEETNRKIENHVLQLHHQHLQLSLLVFIHLFKVAVH